MRRRRRGVAQRSGKQMLGSHLEVAKNNVIRLAKNVIGASVRADFSTQEVIDWTITAEHQDILKRSRGVVSAHMLDTIAETGYQGVRLQYNWSSIGSMCRPEDRVIMHPRPGTPLAALLQRVQDLRSKWVNVMAVVHYFDRYGTPGSARYYFPTLAMLAPEHPQLAEAGLGGGFTDPHRYSQWLPLMRDAATEVATAALSPSYTPPSLTAITLVLPSIEHKILEERFEFGPIAIPLCN
jgi:hypothetical protein